MERGYTKEWRRIFDGQFRGEFLLFYVFKWCVQKANIRDVSWRGIKLKRGQFVTGREIASMDIGCSPSAFYRSILTLQKWGMLNSEANNHGTIITVCNYCTYQDQISKVEQPPEQPPEQHPNSTRTAPEQHPNSTRTLHKNESIKNEALKNHDHENGFFKISQDDFLDTASEDRLYDRMVAGRHIDDSMRTKVNFLASVEHARRVADNPPALLAHIVRQRLWTHATEADEIAAMTKRKFRRTKSALDI